MEKFYRELDGIPLTNEQYAKITSAALEWVTKARAEVTEFAIKVINNYSETPSTKAGTVS